MSVVILYKRQAGSCSLGSDRAVSGVLGHMAENLHKDCSKKLMFCYHIYRKHKKLHYLDKVKFYTHTVIFFENPKLTIDRDGEHIKK